MYTDEYVKIPTSMFRDLMITYIAYKSIGAQRRIEAYHPIIEKLEVIHQWFKKEEK